MSDDIARWLDGLGLGQYSKAFADNAIDRHSLPHLSDDDLKELGLPLGHRRILQAALHQSRMDPAAPIAQRPEASASEAERRQ